MFTKLSGDKETMTNIYELPNHILIYAGDTEPAQHRHMAAHVIISANGMMKVTSDGADNLCRGVMIPSGYSHKIDTYGNPVLVFLYDSTTNVAKRIQQIRCISEIKSNEIIELFKEFEKHINLTQYQKLEKCVLKLLEIESVSSGVIDERIVSAMNFIRSR